MDDPKNGQVIESDTYLDRNDGIASASIHVGDETAVHFHGLPNVNLRRRPSED